MYVALETICLWDPTQFHANSSKWCYVVALGYQDLRMRSSHLQVSTFFVFGFAVLSSVAMVDALKMSQGSQGELLEPQCAQRLLLFIPPSSRVMPCVSGIGVWLLGKFGVRGQWIRARIRTLYNVFLVFFLLWGFLIIDSQD